MIIHHSKNKFKIYPQASRVLNKPSAASFLKLTPWDNPTCPGVTWVSLAGQCHVRGSSCLLFSFCNPRCRKDKNSTQGCPQVTALPLSHLCRFLLSHWSWLSLQVHLQPQGPEKETQRSHLPVQSLHWPEIELFQQISYLERKKKLLQGFLNEDYGHILGLTWRRGRARELALIEEDEEDWELLKGEVTKMSQRQG